MHWQKLIAEKIFLKKNTTFYFITLDTGGIHLKTIFFPQNEALGRKKKHKKIRRFGYFLSDSWRLGVEHGQGISTNKGEKKGTIKKWFATPTRGAGGGGWTQGREVDKGAYAHIYQTPLQL